jgi:hypothetical protein
MFNWISILADGRFEASLTHLALLKNPEERQEGSGQIAWTLSEGVKLRAITSSDAVMFTGDTQYSLGQLISTDACLRLEGTKQEYYNVIATNIYNVPKSTNITTNTQVWEVSLSSVHLYRKLDSEQAAGLLGIVSS